MSAAGEPIDSIHLNDSSISQLLDDFAVGTEKRKLWKQRIKTRPNPSELGPIADMLLRSTAHEAKEAIKRC
jgi:hypothetical protein